MKFVESSDTQQGLPPFNFPKVSIAAFKFPADQQCLDGYCKRFLNIGKNYYFASAEPSVYLGINIYRQMFSDHPAEKEAGYTSQNEYYFMFPVVVHHLTDTNILVPVDIAFIFPFIGVDNAMSAFTGREVLGFPKSCGDIIITPGAPNRFTASVRMPAFANPGRSVPQNNLEIVAVDTGPSVPLQAPSNQAFPWVPRDPTYLNGLFDALFGTGILKSFAVINLKQFRDGEQPLDAAYQALVRCECRMEPIADWVTYENPKIKVTSNATFDIVTDLGLQVGTDGNLVSGPGYAYTTNMWLENVTNLAVI